jgi:hypothetical protein
VSCFNCFISTVGIYRWFEFTILRWITSTWRTCSAAACRWWCLCCNRWLCWIVLVIITILSVVIWLIVEIIIVVVCVLIAVWCLLCNLVCWLGCLGNKGCYDNCVSQGPCDGPVVEIDWAPPVGTGTGTGTGVGTGTSGTGTGTGTGTTPEGLVFSVPNQLVVTRVEQLEDLVQWRRLFSSLTPEIRVDLVNAGAEQCCRLQSAFDRYRTACGCLEGKVGILLASLLLLLMYATDAVAGGTRIGVAIGVVLLGALTGKAYGLFRARVVLRRSVRDFTRSLDSSGRTRLEVI